MKEKILIESKVKKIDSVIAKSLKNMGVVYPHESLAFFRTIYCEFEKANKNKVILAQSVEDDIPQLIGCQVNLGHKRYGFIVGQIIHAFKNKNNQIELVFTFHKSVYDKEYIEIMKSFEKNELTVSFELMVEKKDTEIVKGGNRRLKKVSFDGMGLLVSGETPACSKAIVFESAMRIIEDAFKNENKQLVYASAKDIASKWTRIGELIEKALIEKETISKGDTKMDDKFKKALLATFKEDVTKELGEEAVKDWTDEQWEAELKTRAEAEETVKEEEKPAEKDEVEEASYQCECVECGKKATLSGHCKDSKCSECGGDMRREDRPGTGKGLEEKADEVKPAEKVEEKSSEETAEKTVVEEDVKVNHKVTYDDETNEEIIETESERVVKRDGDVKVVEKVKREVTYTYAQVEEIKAEYDNKLEVKDKEIAFLKENAQKIVEIRADLGEFAKDLSDEELFDEVKIENARLKKENAELKSGKDIEKASDNEDGEKEKSDEDLKTGKEEKEVKDDETSEERVGAYLKTKYGKK